MLRMLKLIQVITSCIFINTALYACCRDKESDFKINMVFNNIIKGPAIQKQNINFKDLRIEYLDVKCGLGEALVLDNHKNVYKLGNGINNFVKNDMPLALIKINIQVENLEKIEKLSNFICYINKSKELFCNDEKDENTFKKVIDKEVLEIKSDLIDKSFYYLTSDGWVHYINKKGSTTIEEPIVLRDLKIRKLSGYCGLEIGNNKNIICWVPFINKINKYIHTENVQKIWGNSLYSCFIDVKDKLFCYNIQDDEGELEPFKFEQIKPIENFSQYVRGDGFEIQLNKEGELFYRGSFDKMCYTHLFGMDYSKNYRRTDFNIKLKKICENINHLICGITKKNELFCVGTGIDSPILIKNGICNCLNDFDCHCF